MLTQFEIIIKAWGDDLRFPTIFLSTLSFTRVNLQNSKHSRMLTQFEIIIKGCGMGPWLVLVSPCFRENEVATCKNGSFLCSLDNLLQKNVIVLFFGNQISKWRSFEKRAIFDLLFTFFNHHGKVTKIPSAHMSLAYIHVFCSPYWLFLPYRVWKKIRIYQIRFLFGMSPGVDSYSRHFGTINK